MGQELVIGLIRAWLVGTQHGDRQYIRCASAFGKLARGLKMPDILKEAPSDHSVHLYNSESPQSFFFGAHFS